MDPTKWAARRIDALLAFECPSDIESWPPEEIELLRSELSEALAAERLQQKASIAEVNSAPPDLVVRIARRHRQVMLVEDRLRQARGPQADRD